MNKSIFVFTVTTVIFSAAWAMSQKPAEKKALKTSVQNPKIKAAGKSIGYFRMNVTAQNHGSGEVTLKGQVLPQQSMMQAQYQWQLPEGVKVLSGQLQGSMDFPKGELKVLELTVSEEGLKEKDNIYLFVNKEIKGQKHGGSVTHVYSKHGDFEKSSLKNKKAKKIKKYFE